ncbi:non-specific lipid transfer protein GPI-anchored 2-like [Phalaenopsis equestris]|uniref:non-specific lipid transfer protein GPI-anchored 2-like n=1 Tax=Phalaenopsis equestris TaxID=78828 RepID=UPI0009E1AC9E|nr:non-specific lipid transfer protein GPI-anchored 2-like [Phalaenopsis equestris]
MALRKRVFVLTLFMITIVRLVPRRSSAQSDCTSTIISLAPCLNYITGSTDTPAVACCSQLEKVVQSEPRCLCLILDGGAAQFGVTVNQTKALELPGACSVQTPPVSRCKDAAAVAPAPPPGSGSETTPGGVSRGSFLQPVAFPVVFSVGFIILAYFSMHYMSS